MPEIKTVSVHELKKLKEENPDIWIIDVREPHEWDAGHIPGAIHIPKDQITKKIQQYVPNYDCPIYLNCGGGKRSMTACVALHELGYEELYSVEGGITAWKKSGFPVER